jgi:hypothetical protein
MRSAVLTLALALPAYADDWERDYQLRKIQRGVDDINTRLQDYEHTYQQRREPVYRYGDQPQYRKPLVPLRPLTPPDTSDGSPLGAIIIIAVLVACGLWWASRKPQKG